MNSLCYNHTLKMLTPEVISPEEVIYINILKKYDILKLFTIGNRFALSEVLQASICLFSALTDAHALNVGIVDLKLENFLVIQ